MESFFSESWSCALQDFKFPTLSFFGARILDLWGGVHECAQHEGTGPGAQLLFLSR
jgi:hypothetical protein